MISRRQFIKSTGVAAAGIAANLHASPLANLGRNKDFITNRPSYKERTFISDAVEKTIVDVKRSIKNPELSWLFENCFPNTLDTTVDYEIIEGKPDAFIITGDIDAMWLRDSTAQIWPYLPLVKQDQKLRELFIGLINRQTKCINLDPYANAFFKDFSRETHWKDDKPTPQPGIHERKWEIDSLCYPIRLAYGYYQKTEDTSIFDADWDKAMRSVFKTFKTEQRKDGKSPYYFIRKMENYTVTASFIGKGRPIKPNGLICSIFRPSDDGTMYPFLIPSNLFAVQSLNQLSELYIKVFNDNKFALECSKLADEVLQAVNEHAIFDHLNYGEIYAYEIDGFGNRLFTDDPNIPSLISIPYLLDEKYFKSEIYENTRRYLLSSDNPYYFKGKAGEGQGGPHAGLDTIWPMGIILRAMTSNDDHEILWCIRQLMKTNTGKGFMHETFHKDDPNNFTREWFAWANTLFGELILKLYNEKPDFLKTI